MTIKPNRDDTKTLGDALLRRNGYGTDPDPKSKLHRAANFYIDHAYAIHTTIVVGIIVACCIWGNFGG